MQPSPRLRISPSGPFTAGDTDPLREYVGMRLTPDVTNLVYINQIGPPPNAPNHWIYRAGKPVTAGITASTNKRAYSSILNGIETGIGLTTGNWEVECELSVGFDTTNPVNGECGLLEVSVGFVNDAGVQAAGTTFTISSGLARNIAGTTAGQVTHTTTYRAIVEITPADIAANGNKPLEGVFIGVTRRNDPAQTPYGVYDTGSGALMITSDTKVSIKRFR